MWRVREKEIELGAIRNDEVPVTAEEIAKLFSEALDGIELLDNDEREDLIRWADERRSLGFWGLPGREVLIGIHNKCVRLPDGRPHVEQSPGHYSVKTSDL